MKEEIHISISHETPFNGIIKAGGKEFLLTFDILNYTNKDIKLSEIYLKYNSDNIKGENLINNYS